MMKEYEELVVSLNNIANMFTTLKPKEQQEILLKNNEILEKFKDNLELILRLYHFKEKDNIAQNQVADQLKNVISMLLEQKDFFESQPEYQYFLSDLLDKLSFNENRFAFRLQYEKNMHNAQCAIEYMQTRVEYIGILEKNDNIQINDMNKNAISNYIFNRYEENMIGHALIVVKNNFLSLEKEEIAEIIKCIDNSNFFDKFIQKNNKQMDFYDKNLIFQYTGTILNLKSIFASETINNDIFVQAMWNGEIKDSKMIQAILKNISTNCFEKLMGEEFDFMKMAAHFKEVGYSDKQIATIINGMMAKGADTFDVAKVLTNIDIPKNFEELINSEYAQEYSWLLEGDVFDTFKKSEAEIEDAHAPYLPAEYYIKKLDSTPEINKQIIQNLIVVLHSDYYTEEEREALINALKRNNFYPSNIIGDEEITFDKEDSFGTKMDKMIKIYFNGRVVPIDVATSILNTISTQQHSNNDKINKMKKLLARICVQSIISNELSKKNVDIGNRVFFGNGHNENLGYYDREHKCIWIDENLIEKFVNNQDLGDKKELFTTMFHEMQHAIQHNNIEMGNINYLTYNFIKEAVIIENDENYYDVNYISYYKEADARREGILGALEFIKGLNPKFVEIIRKEMELEYIQETQSHTIYDDSQKKIDIGTKSTQINVSEYVGLLIQANPKILVENPILGVEYNLDGSRKNIETLLNEFEKKKLENDFDYSNMYSIYYGLISKQLEDVKEQDSEIQKQLSIFLKEQPEIITLEDMQLLYEKVPIERSKEVYKRLTSLTRNTRATGETLGEDR